MTTSRIRTPSGLLLAVVLAVLACFVGWLAFQAAAVRALPRGTPLLAQVAPDHPDAVLDQAVIALVKNRGVLSPAELAAVRRAALRAPLDARPFLILGHESLLQSRNDRAVAQLEAGQRLDARQRLIHLLLLDRYLRTDRYAAAATQFGVLARLVGSAHTPIAGALAQMSVAPDTREATRRTLRSDPRLEQSVLTALARSDTDPAAVLGLASPTALAAAGAPTGWGTALVDRMVGKGQYAAARTVWQRLHGLSDAQLASPIFDAELRGLPGTPPFNWGLASDGTGAVDLRNGTLSIDYYGRNTGELVTQLLVLRPGAYRFNFVLGGSPTAAGTTLSWSLACAGAGGRSLMTLTVPPVAASPRKVAAAFTVPAGCPAQRLVLAGNAGEFAAPITATIEAPTITATGPGSGSRS